MVGSIVDGCCCGWFYSRRLLLWLASSWKTLLVTKLKKKSRLIQRISKTDERKSCEDHLFKNFTIYYLNLFTGEISLLFSDSIFNNIIIFYCYFYPNKTRTEGLFLINISKVNVAD